MTENIQIDDIIKRALKEDIKSGDITTLATIEPGVKAKAEFLAKDSGIIAGLETGARVFSLVNPELKFVAYTADGAKVHKGDIVASVEGSAAAIITAERTALNFMQRMSGIATAANKYAKLVSHTKAVILDTRKTVPGLRTLDKIAVKTGGGVNHRIGLYDMFLIKDNHIAVAGSVTRAIEACRKYASENKLDCKIEVETKNIEEVQEALVCKPDIIMLDNFSVGDMKKAVEIINGASRVEASGGVNPESVRAIAETGVDFISVGALTHSVKALDISLNIKLNL
jgi:nicotinate-nucleotide pyrophosphorylase (carboxylating)